MHLQSESAPSLKYNHDNFIDPIIGLFKPLIIKYPKKDLQKIFKIVLKAQASPFNGPYEKPLKTRLFDVYCSKSYIEYYNFCQQYEDYFVTAKAKSLSYILFVTSFLRDCINFC